MIKYLALLLCSLCYGLQLTPIRISELVDSTIDRDDSRIYILCEQGVGLLTLDTLETVGLQSELITEATTKMSYNVSGTDISFNWSIEDKMSNSPIGGCYNVGGESSGDKADPRAGCYFFDKVNCEGSILCRPTIPSSSGAVKQWKDFLRTEVTPKVMKLLCGNLRQNESRCTTLTNTSLYAQLLMSMYPVTNGMDSQKLELSTAIGEHTDYGFFAYTIQAIGKGLTVKLRDGSYVEVPYIPNTISIIGGEILETVTDGRCRAVPHKVDPVLSDRLSITTFVNPSVYSKIKRGMLVASTSSDHDENNAYYWGDYEVFTYCRMFSHRKFDTCVAIFGNSRYSDMEFHSSKTNRRYYFEKTEL